MSGAKKIERISTLKAIKRFITRLLLGLGLSVMGAPAMAVDKVLEVEIHNATTAPIAPGEGFSWLESPQNAGHDFVVEPGGSQELTYYMPQARGSESFSYQQGERECAFSFSHLTPANTRINRQVNARSTGKMLSRCRAELIQVIDDDDFVSNGGTRVLFTMGQ